MQFLLENLIGILVACVVILIFIRLRKRLNYFQEKGWPHITHSWKEIINFNFFSDLHLDIYTRCQGIELSYVGYMRPFLKPTILVLDPSLVERILIKDFSYFHDHGLHIDVDSMPLTGHLFNMKGSRWRTLRYKLLPFFSSSKLRGMVPIMEEAADKLIQQINQDPSLKKDVNLKDLFKTYSLAVIASTVFGIDPKSIEDPNCPLRKTLQEISSPKLSTLIKFGLGLIFPKLFKILNVKFPSEEGEEYIISLVKETLKTRKESGVKRTDFMQQLLELKERGSVEIDIKNLEQDVKDDIETQQFSPNKLEFTDELLAAQAFGFLVGGFENIAYIVALTIYVLSKHPEIQTRVREEVNQQKDKHGRLDYRALREMKLLAACINEAVRLYPTTTSTPRECNKTYVLSDGNKIEKGMSIIIPTKAIHLDSKYWSEPEKFKPDRFLNGEKSTPGTYLPFGAGPRMCIGERMTLIIAKLMLSKLVLNYEFQPSAKTKEPIQINAMFIADAVGGFWGNFKNLNE